MEFDYWAFVSYSHLDEQWARWLHRSLERYRVPRRLVGRPTPWGDVPARIAPVFRDREELPTATDLSRAVNAALERSAALIVICSPSAAQSHWVNEEIRAFQRLGRADRIFCLIVDGDPAGPAGQQCFPQALRATRLGADSAAAIEPIAADLREGKDGRHNALLKLIAGLLGLGLDELTRRDLQRRQRRLLTVAAAAVVGMAITSLLAGLAVIARNEAVRQRSRAELAEQEARAISEFLQNDLLAQASADQQAGPDTNPDPDLTVRTALDRAAGRAEGRFVSQPAVEAAIRHTMGETYYGLGLYPEAESQLQRTLELRRLALGDSDPDTLKTMGALTRVLGMQGKYEEAETLSVKALAGQRSTLGMEHPDTLNSMDDLGSIYRRQGKYSEAEMLFTEVLEARRRLFGESDEQTLLTMGYLAELYERQGRYEEAEQLAASVLEAQRRVLGEEHPQTLLSKNRLAVTYFRQRQYARAADLFEQVLAIQRRVLGEEHPDTLTTMSNLSTMYAYMGDYERAEPLRVTTLERLKRVLGPEHPNTLVAGANLGALYRAQGRYAEAESLLAENLDARRRVHGPDHPDTLSAMTSLAVTYLREANYRQGEALTADALDARQRVLGPEHPSTMESLILLSLLQLQQQKYGEAALHARDALDIIESTRPDDWQRYYASCVLGTAVAGQSRYDEAETLLLSGYDGVSQRVSSLPLDYRSAPSECGTWIVELYQEWGRSADASEWRRQLSESVDESSVRE